MTRCGLVVIRRLHSHGAQFASRIPFFLLCFSMSDSELFDIDYDIGVASSVVARASVSSIDDGLDQDQIDLPELLPDVRTIVKEHTRQHGKAPRSVLKRPAQYVRRSNDCIAHARLARSKKCFERKAQKLKHERDDNKALV